VAVVRNGAIASELSVGYEPACVAVRDDRVAVGEGGQGQSVHVYAFSARLVLLDMLAGLIKSAYGQEEHYCFACPLTEIQSLQCSMQYHFESTENFVALLRNCKADLERLAVANTVS
jgi:hypothetical protein